MREQDAIAITITALAVGAIWATILILWSIRRLRHHIPKR